MRTPTNPFETTDTADEEVHVPKETMSTGLSVDSFDPELHCNWKNEDGSDIPQDVDVLFWWRDVGEDRFPRTSVISRHFLSIPPVTATDQLLFSFAGLTLSDLCKSLLEGTL